jgi:hypothetical protein
VPWSGPGGIADLATRAVARAFGQSATYTTPDGLTTAAVGDRRGIFDEAFESLELIEGVATMARTPILDVRLADLVDGSGVLVVGPAPSPLSTPEDMLGGTVVVGGRTWEVVHVKAGGQNTSAKLELALLIEPA